MFQLHPPPSNAQILSVKLDKNLECICKVHTITIVDERTTTTTTSTSAKSSSGNDSKKKKERKKSSAAAWSTPSNSFLQDSDTTHRLDPVKTSFVLVIRPKRSPMGCTGSRDRDSWRSLKHDTGGRRLFWLDRWHSFTEWTSYSKLCRDIGNEQKVPT